MERGPTDTIYEQGKNINDLFMRALNVNLRY